MTRAAIRVLGAAIAATLAAVVVCTAAPPAAHTVRASTPPVRPERVEGRTSCSARGPSLATNIDTAAIARAIALGRSPDSADRQRFHDAYFIRLNAPLLDRLEIVTEFRRVVLATEDRARATDTDWGPRQAVDMLQAWRGRIALVLHVTFPPHNTYRAMPRFDLVLYGRPGTRAPARIEPLGLMETPRYVSGQPAPTGTPILAGLIEAVFGAADIDPLGVYLAGIGLEGRELRRVEVDFGRIE